MLSISQIQLHLTAVKILMIQNAMKILTQNVCAIATLNKLAYIVPCNQAKSRAQGQNQTAMT